MLAVDFSDTHELAYILGVAPLNISAFLARYLLGAAAGRTVDGGAAILPAECERTRAADEQALWPLRALAPAAPPPHALPAWLAAKPSVLDRGGGGRLLLLLGWSLPILAAGVAVGWRRLHTAGLAPRGPQHAHRLGEEQEEGEGTPKTTS